jgi:hypothetical protein
MLPQARRIDKRDLFIPSVDDDAWHRFITAIFAVDKYDNDEQEAYEDVIASFGQQYGYKMLDYVCKRKRMNSDGHRLTGGYVFRFKDEQSKLAFLLKWG